MIANTKSELRKKYKSVRNSIDANMRKYKSMIICDKLLDFISQNNILNIFAYNSFSSEVDTTQLIERISENINVYLPKCNVETETMKPIKFNVNDKYTENIYGIKEIAEDREFEFCNFDLIIVPGISFDKTGKRIGYGKGYYDKFISSLDYNPIKMGICYSEQICIEGIPADEYDIDMDIVMTDEDTIFINKT